MRALAETGLSAVAGSGDAMPRRGNAYAGRAAFPAAPRGAVCKTTARIGAPVNLERLPDRRIEGRP